MWLLQLHTWGACHKYEMKSETPNFHSSDNCKITTFACSLNWKSVLSEEVNPAPLCTSPSQTSKPVCEQREQLWEKEKHLVEEKLETRALLLEFVSPIVYYQDFSLLLYCCTYPTWKVERHNRYIQKEKAYVQLLQLQHSIYVYTNPSSALDAFKNTLPYIWKKKSQNLQCFLLLCRRPWDPLQDSIIKSFVMNISHISCLSGMVVDDIFILVINKWNHM